MASVARGTPTTAGMPYSRATTAPWLLAPPISITSPPAVRNSGVQPGSVDGATRISPGSRRAPTGSRMTRAGAVTVPADAGVPRSAPAWAAADPEPTASSSVPSDSRTRGTCRRRSSASYRSLRSLTTVRRSSPAAARFVSSKSRKKTSSGSAIRPDPASSPPIWSIAACARRIAVMMRNFGISRIPTSARARRRQNRTATARRRPRRRARRTSVSIMVVASRAPSAKCCSGVSASGSRRRYPDSTPNKCAGSSDHRGMPRSISATAR